MGYHRLSMCRWVRMLGVGIVAAASSRVATAQTIPFKTLRATKRVQAVRISEPITVDGLLDEGAWDRAEPATDFYQQQPDEGKLSAYRSEVRFVYDDDSLYIGGTFFDPDPDRIIVNELKRDFGARDGDSVSVVFDPFHDERNATSFQANASGAQRDLQAYDDSRVTNSNWDAVWWVKTSRFPGGWRLEMRIPFKTLRFTDAEQQVWGLQIQRVVRRTNEVSLWSPLPRQFNQYKVSYAGTLEGISGITPSPNFRIQPFASGQVSRGDKPGVSGTTTKGDGGFDIKYGIGRALTLDGSYRTDFSQVESDAQQLNLTRFSLFFPEKRQFFLENQGAFRMGDQDPTVDPIGRGIAAVTSVRRDFIPFFSRRIGLSNAGEPIPMLGGTRLTGKSGAYSLGLLAMRTEGTDTIEPRTYTTVRVSREVGAGSSIGGFYLGSDAASDFNKLIGADVHLNVARANDIDAFVVKSSSPVVSGPTTFAGRVAVQAKHPLYLARASYTNIQKDFRDDLGFIPRPNLGLFTVEFQKDFRPKRTYQWVRSYTIGGEGDLFYTAKHDQLVTRTWRHDYALEFPDGGIATAEIFWNREVLNAPFTPSAGVVVPPGVYEFRQFVTGYTSNKSKALSGNAKLTDGEYYAGQIRGVDGGARVRLSEQLAVSATYTRNSVHLPQGSYDATITSFRVDQSFSTRVFLNAFIQRNNTTHTWQSNIRLDFMHHPLSDLYLVYNDTRGSSLAPPVHAVIVKYSHLLSF